MRQDVSVSFAPPRDTGFPPFHPSHRRGCQWCRVLRRLRACDRAQSRSQIQVQVHIRRLRLPPPPRSRRTIAVSRQHALVCDAEEDLGTRTLSKHLRSSTDVPPSLIVFSKGMFPEVRARLGLGPSLMAMDQAASPAQHADRPTDIPGLRPHRLRELRCRCRGRWQEG